MNPKRQSKTSPVPARTDLSGGRPGHPGGGENGFIIIAVIALIAILALVGTVAVITTTTEIKISSNYKTRTQAFYIAEAGVHRAIGMLNDATTDDWIGSFTEEELATNVFPDNSLGNGTYQVEVEDDPATGSVRITSTGSASTSSSTVEAIVTKQYYDILLNYAMFDCGDIILQDTMPNTISGGDVYVKGNLDLETNSINLITDGDVYSLGSINIGGSSRIENGNVFVNGNIDLNSSASPNIEGNATAKGVVSGSGTVSGTTIAGASPDPVSDLCSGTNLADITMPSEDIQDLKDNATMYEGNFIFDDNVDYTGIVHITGNFTLEDDATFSDNVIFIVDGNVEIKGSLTSASESSVTFIVPDGDFEVTGAGGDYTIDGVLLVGTINEDGSGISNPHNIDVKDGANLTVNGTVITVNGNTDAMNGGELTVNYQSPNDSNLMEPNSYKMTQWREIRN